MSVYMGLDFPSFTPSVVGRGDDLSVFDGMSQQGAHRREGSGFTSTSNQVTDTGGHMTMTQPLQSTRGMTYTVRHPSPYQYPLYGVPGYAPPPFYGMSTTHGSMNTTLQTHPRPHHIPYPATQMQSPRLVYPPPQPSQPSTTQRLHQPLYPSSQTHNFPPASHQGNRPSMTGHRSDIGLGQSGR
eukprot:GHVN01010486.1.p2 GENE.GHVN01010486.1~~GHVN01010486.1.p2  ORF type:complete len:184 (+),score=51.53 GHVN01010486.1:1207-1758(+)